MSAIVRFMREHITWEVVREIATIIALICGSAWAVYESRALYRAEIAALQVTELEQKTERQPVIEINVKASATKFSNKTDVIRVEVILHNKGKLKEILDLSNKPLRIYPVSFDGCDNCLLPSTGAWLEANMAFPVPADKLMLLPGSTQRFRTLYQVPREQVPQVRTYYVEFAVRLSPESRKLWQDLRQIEKGDIEWFDGVFVQVPSG